MHLLRIGENILVRGRGQTFSSLLVTQHRLLGTLANCICWGLFVGVMARNIIGKRRGGDRQDEREHFMKCQDCGRWIDMRNVADVVAHERACDGALARSPPSR